MRDDNNSTINQEDSGGFQDGPTRPEKLQTEFLKTDDAVMLKVSSSKGRGYFLLLWLCGWSVGCVFLAGMVVNEPSLGNIAFAVPFFAAWIAVAVFLAWCFWGEEKILLLRNDRAVFQRKAIIQLTSRTVPISEVNYAQQTRSRYQENEEYLWGIELVTLGKPLKFGFRLPDQEREWLVNQLNKFLKDDSGAAVPQHIPVQSNAAVAKAPSAQWVVMRSDSVLEDAPSDSRWQLAQLPSGSEFSRYGDLNLGSLFGLLFINAFWNGIVSVFVLVLFGVMPVDNPEDLQGPMWWGMFVFLIPFEVIGVIMLCALVMVILNPFCRTVWRFDTAGLMRQCRYPLFTLTKRWDVTNVVSLRLTSTTETSRNTGFTSTFASQNEYGLTFVNDDKTDCCSITPVTEGEARWMAGVLFGSRPEWKM